MDKRPVKYFYCGSTQALLLALAHDDFVVISKTTIANRLCNMFNRELLCVKTNIDIKHLVLNPAKTKLELARLISIIKVGELHFSHIQFAIFCFLLALNARKNDIPVYFHNFEFNYPKASGYLIFIKNLKTYMFGKMITFHYKIRFVYKQVHSLLVLGIDDSFITSNSIHLIDDKDTFFNSTLNLFIKAPARYKTYDNIFLSQNLVNNKFVDRTDLFKMYAWLLENGINVKLHPGMKEHEQFYFKDLLIDDNSVPVELLFNSVKKSVIAFHSAALITAAKFNHLKSISVIDLLKTNDNDFIMKVKADLQVKSDGKIFFPQTLDELERLIKI